MNKDIDVVSLLRELDSSIEERTSARSWLLRSTENDIFSVVVPSVQHVLARTVRIFTFHQGSPVRPLFVGRPATAGVLEQAMSRHVDVLTQRPLQLITKDTIFTPGVEHPAPTLRKATSGKKA